MNTEENDRDDVLGRTYEYFLVQFSKNAGKGGEFFTPPCIVKTLVDVIQPFKGHVYEKTLPTLIQTNETYESTQIDAFLRIEANAQRQEYKMAS